MAIRGLRTPSYTRSRWNIRAPAVGTFVAPLSRHELVDPCPRLRRRGGKTGRGIAAALPSAREGVVHRGAPALEQGL